MLFQTRYEIDEYCEDTNGEAVNSHGRSCYEYANYLCDLFIDRNDDDFNAQEMCCICGGGIKHGKK